MKNGWKGGYGRSGATTLAALAAALCLAVSAVPARADESPKYAERGVSAYRAGKYDLARMFFAKALQDAVLRGREEWVAKATFNLVDLEMESDDLGEAGRLLEGMSPRDPGARAIWLWKRSQLEFMRRRQREALVLIDSALVLVGSAGEAAAAESVALPMRTDRLRYRIRSDAPSAWGREYEALRGRIGRRKSAPLDAMASMARGNYGRADSLWNEAIGYYRDQGRLAKMAACLNQSAIGLFALGRREEASEANARAVAIYGELGLEIPALKSQALRLLLVEDEAELAKLRRDMDLLGQRFTGFDLKGILDEYSHSLRIGVTRPGD